MRTTREAPQQSVVSLSHTLGVGWSRAYSPGSLGSLAPAESTSELSTSDSSSIRVSAAGPATRATISNISRLRKASMAGKSAKFATDSTDLRRRCKGFVSRRVCCRAACKVVLRIEAEIRSQWFVAPTCQVFPLNPDTPRRFGWSELRRQTIDAHLKRR